MVQIKRIAHLSVGKGMGLICGGLGLLFGAIFSRFNLIGSVAASELPGDALFGVLFEVGAVIAMPLLSGTIGFVMGIVFIDLHSPIDGWIGGAELVLE